MAFPPHALVALQGKFGSSDMPNEVWQVGIRVSTHDPSGGYLADPDAYCGVVAPLIVTWFNGSPLIGTNVSLNTVKVNNIKPDGHYKDTTTHLRAAPATGGLGGQTVPAFCTVAATLETGHTTGTARRGRVYVPFGVPLDAGKLVSISAANMTAIRDKIDALLHILLRNETVGGLLVVPIIASRKDGNYNDITGTSVNSVYDVQRRRKNRASATRSAIKSFPV